MRYTMTITFDTDTPLTEDELDALNEAGAHATAAIREDVDFDVSLNIDESTCFVPVDPPPPPPPSKPRRIKVTDSLGNVAYIHNPTGKGFQCVLANGIPAALHYAGIPHGNEMAAKFALDDAPTDDERLAIVQRMARGRRVEFA